MKSIPTFLGQPVPLASGITIRKLTQEEIDEAKKPHPAFIETAPSWRPIETAPTGGVMFLTYAPDHWGGQPTKPYITCFRGEDGELFDADGYPVDATHWMAFPEAPVGSQGT